MVQKIPPPPPLGINDQPLNRWLIELQNIINGGGAIDATAVTQPPGTNNTTIATTAFVFANGAGVPPSTTVPLVDATPGQIGTSTHFARGDHQHPTDTSRAALASPTFTGDPKAPTPAPGDNDTSIATTAFVAAADALLAPLASPTFTGTPAAPTPTLGDNTTKLATTAFVGAATAALAAVRNGSGVPAAGLGNNGDLYINNTGGGGTRLYGKIAGAWVAIA